MWESIYALCWIIGSILTFLFVGLTIDYINKKRNTV